MKLSGRKKIIAGIVIASIIVTIGITVFAADNGVFRSKGRGLLGRASGFQEAVDSLIEDGQITEEIANEMEHFLNMPLLEKMEYSNIISNKQKEAIRQRQRDLAGEKLENALSRFVQEGVLTENDVDNIVSYLDTHRQERFKEMQKIREETKDMTFEERKEYMQQLREEKQNLLDKMIEDGIITQEQADEIKELIHCKGRPFHKRRPGGGMGGRSSCSFN